MGLIADGPMGWVAVLLLALFAWWLYHQSLRTRLLVVVVGGLLMEVRRWLDRGHKRALRRALTESRHQGGQR